MSTQTFIDKFEELPPEARKQAADFVAFLYERYVKAVPKPASDKPLSESSFVGMWADRADMTDSTEWVRKQRKELWER
ncbi:MAG: DUF2281 domain-containing protein [Candidatus Cyclonatronum sp.]|uniref:DUF2281 domain-containing protein n=1 Tax=Cyclonatronum sp. TaxID=3024185 RepID=UPI0025BDF9E8|nr:DUF2281 domain-containing protein [Cyclonatronum sp.]MCH8487685.1 DUF2281 domain-containing protein [Cyclonatronum sp.]